MYRKYANLATFKITVGGIRGRKYTLTKFPTNKLFLIMCGYIFFEKANILHLPIKILNDAHNSIKLKSFMYHSQGR